MHEIYVWAQAQYFKIGLKGNDAKSYITCVLFPQPLLPFIRLAEEEGVEKERCGKGEEPTSLGCMLEPPVTRQ